CAAVLGEGVEPGQMDRGATDGRALERPACGLLRLRVGAELLVWVRRRVDEREGRPAVVGDEGPGAGRGGGGDPGSRQRLAKARIDVRKLFLHRGRIDSLALRQGDHREQWRRV